MERTRRSRKETKDVKETKETELQTFYLVVYDSEGLGTITRTLTQLQLAEVLKNPKVTLISVNDTGGRTYRKVPPRPVKRKKG